MTATTLAAPAIDAPLPPDHRIEARLKEHLDGAAWRILFDDDDDADEPEDEDDKRRR